MEKQEILTERNVVVEVLEKYRKLPHLWNPTHKLYTNKHARQRGLEAMLESWRKLEPNANLECIRKKLNNWRAAYRRERKKVEDSMITATEPDEIHKPNLWYYDHLTFIHDDCPVLSRDGEGDGEIDWNLTFGSEMVEEGNVTLEEQMESAEEEVETQVEPKKKPRISLKQKLHDRSFKQELVLVESTQNVNSGTDENSADLFGRAIGSQLKEISKFQRCLAEKLISEIIFYAKLEQLTIKSSITLEESDSS